MAHLTIIRGIPGSGKSTLAKTIPAIHVEADMYFMSEGVYYFDYNYVKKAHEWCLQEVKKNLRDGLDVVVSNTFTRHWEMKSYKELVTKENLTVITATGNYQNIHGVPAHVINNMIIRWEG